MKFRLRFTALILVLLCLWQGSEEAACTPLELYDSQTSVGTSFDGQGDAGSNFSDIVRNNMPNPATLSTDSIFEALSEEPGWEQQSFSDVRTLEELINSVGASAGANARIAAGRSMTGQQAIRAGAQGPPRAGQGRTLKDVARTLMNSQGNRAGASDTTGHGTRGGGFSILSSIIRIELNPDIIQAISRIISPRINLGGTVSFSVFGMGDFAFAKSVNPGMFNIVNIAKGTRVSVNYANRRTGNKNANTGGAFYRGAHPNGPLQREDMSDKIVRAKEWLDEILHHPLFIFAAVTFGFFLLIWKMWRVQNRKIPPKQPVSRHQSVAEKTRRRRKTRVA